MKALGGAAAAIIATPGEAALTINQRYVNRALGVTFCRPRDWQWAELTTIGQAAANQIYESDTQALVEMIRKIQGPMVTCSRGPLTDDPTSIAPSLYMMVPDMDVVFPDNRRLRNLLGSEFTIEYDLEEQALADLKNSSALVPQFEVVASPALRDTNGVSAVETTFSYHMNTPIGSTLGPIRSRNMFMQQDMNLYVFRAVDAPSLGLDESVALEESLNTIQLLKRQDSATD